MQNEGGSEGRSRDVDPRQQESWRQWLGSCSNVLSILTADKRARRMLAFSLLKADTSGSVVLLELVCLYSSKMRRKRTCSGIIYTVPKYVRLRRGYFMPCLVLIMSLGLIHSLFVVVMWAILLRREMVRDACASICPHVTFLLCEEFSL